MRGSSRMRLSKRGEGAGKLETGQMLDEIDLRFLQGKQDRIPVGKLPSALGPLPAELPAPEEMIRDARAHLPVQRK